MVDTIYFDEAHNSVQKNFSLLLITSLSMQVDAIFTATPKHSRSPEKAGMNWIEVYGGVICQAPAPKLVKQGYILPPKVKVYRSRILKKDELVADRDNEQMIGAIDNLIRTVLYMPSQPDRLLHLFLRQISYSNLRFVVTLYVYYSKDRCDD